MVNLKRDCLYSMLLCLSLGLSVSVNSSDVDAKTSNKVVVKKKTSSKTRAKDQEVSGKIEDVPYTIKDNVVTLGGGTIKEPHDGGEHDTPPWNSTLWGTIREIKLTKPITFEGAGPRGFFTSLSYNEVTSISGLKFINTSEATDMTGMFANTPYLKHLDLDLPNFDTSKVTDMNFMFKGDLALTKLNVANFNTSKVTNMERMFSWDEGLKTLDISNFDTSRVTNMQDMLSYSGFRTLNLASLNTSQVTNTRDMFANDDFLWHLKLGPEASNNALTSLPNHSKGDPIPDSDPVRKTSGSGWQAVGNGNVDNPQGHLYPSLADFVANRPAETENYVWEQIPTLNLKYSQLTISANQSWKPEDAFDSATDAGGRPLTFKDITVTGVDSSGKPVSDLNNLTQKPGVYTLHYRIGTVSKELQLTVNQSTTSPSPSPAPLPTPSPQPAPSPNPTNPITPPTISSQPIGPNDATKIGAAVYGINKFYLYKQATFTKSQRLAKYVKKPRIYRPMFVVTDYARSANGKLRYQVTDVNRHSRTAGRFGYITANWKYVRPVYYATKHARITVISPRGINAYKRENLAGKVKKYRQGTVLKVKGLVKHNLTTRYLLTNGRYVTANRKLVNIGRHKTVKKVRAKTRLNRYRNVNLSRRNKPFKKGTVFKVYNYDYSHSTNFHKHGALRYRVAGGYITGNRKYVKIIG